MSKHREVGAVVFVLLTLVAADAAAHRAEAIGGTYDGPALAVQMGAADESQVVYGDLPVTHASLWVAVDVSDATDLNLELGVPVLERLRTYRPQLAILGPGLPPLAVPVDVPAGLGGMLVVTSSVTDAARFHEPITDTDSWILAEDVVRLPSPGRYYIVAWSTSLMDGKAWIAIGQRETFGVSDIGTLPQVIRDVRAFHELGPDPRFVVAAKALYLTVIAAAIALLSFL